MSGLTKDALLQVQRRITTLMHDGELLRQQINDTLKAIQTASRDDAEQLIGQVQRALADERASRQRLADDLTRLSTMGLGARLRWLLLGRLPVALLDVPHAD